MVTTAVLLAASPSADAYGLQVNEGEGEQTPDGGRIKTKTLKVQKQKVPFVLIFGLEF